MADLAYPDIRVQHGRLADRAKRNADLRDREAYMDRGFQRPGRPAVASMKDLFWSAAVVLLAALVLWLNFPVQMAQ
jgi:hypothetical protein